MEQVVTGQGTAGRMGKESGGGAYNPHSYSFLSLEEHIVDIFISNVLMGALLALGVWSHRRRNAEKLLEMKHKKAPLSLVERGIVVILSVSFFLNLFYKAGLGWIHLVQMLFPCHVLSLCYIYVLCTSNTRRATYMFNLIVFYTHNTFLALMFPDLENVKFLFQYQIFWLQHATLFLTPYVLVWNQRFELYRGQQHGIDFLMKALAVMFIFHINLHAIPGLLTGVNLSYLLWPPNSTSPILHGRYYKYKMAAILSALAWVVGYPALWTVQLARHCYDYLTKKKTRQE